MTPLLSTTPSLPLSPSMERVVAAARSRTVLCPECGAKLAFRDGLPGERLCHGWREADAALWAVLQLASALDAARSVPRGTLPERGRARRTDPDTSHAAGRSTLASRGHALVWLALEPGPLSDHGLVRALAGRLSPSGARTRRAELARAGLVHAVGTVPGELGREVTLWARVPDARGPGGTR